MRYVWDEAKNRINIAKHGLNFADAARVLTGRCVTFVDDRVDYGEERFISIGTLVSVRSAAKLWWWSIPHAAPT
ncbi:MAG: BrnT family toxin [Deltaproteobacteria bacterium]|nr:BrnT family toxin [Deltaproteobacteria bacterium]